MAAELPHPEVQIDSIAFSRDGRLFAMADSLSTIQLFTFPRMAPVATLENPDRRQLRAMVFSPDATKLAAAGTGQLVLIWDLALISGNWLSCASPEICRLMSGRAFCRMIRTAVEKADFEPTMNPTDRTDAMPMGLLPGTLGERAVANASVDPRSRPDFRPRFYPTANAENPPPAEATGRNDRVILEFLAAYYELNCRYEALLEARRQPDLARRQREERGCLQAIEKVLIVRDALEDRHAPFGVIAEAKISDGFVTDVAFSFGNVDAKGKRRSGSFTITAHVPLPLALTPGAGFDDWAVRIEPKESAPPPSNPERACGN